MAEPVPPTLVLIVWARRQIIFILQALDKSDVLNTSELAGIKEHYPGAFALPCSRP